MKTGNPILECGGSTPPSHGRLEGRPLPNGEPTRVKPPPSVLHRAIRRMIPALPLILLFAACDNMKHQPSLRPMEDTTQFPNGSSAQTPPPHTIARGTPPPRAVMTTGVTNGALTNDLPVPLTRDLLTRGRERFNAYCAPCHGEDGYGQGIVVRRGFPAPPSYHNDRLRSAPVGHVFDVITHGYGVMYSYADRVTVSDRWAIAAYIRALQRSQHATLADVPPERRDQLSSR